MKSNFNKASLDTNMQSHLFSVASKVVVLFMVIGLLLFPLQARLYAEGQLAKIKVAQYNKTFTFSCKAGASWRLGASEGSISKSDTCVVEGRLDKKAVREFHVVVKSVPLENKAELNDEALKWKKQGWDLKIIEIGEPLTNKVGKIVNDNRLAAGEIEVFSDEKSAKELVEKLTSLGQSSRIFEKTLQLPKGKITLKVNGKIKAVGEDLVLFPTETVLLKKVEYAAGYPWHGFQDRSYRGQLNFHWGAKNAIDCILFTTLEEVLAGVVPSEISANAAVGALCAQAVAARGDIMSKMGVRHVGEGFDVCAEQHCQVYKGETKYSIAVGKKISSTAGYVLTNVKGKILGAVYSSNCGGHTEANHLVWSSAPDPILAGTWDHPNPPSIDLSEEKQVRDFILNPPKCFCNDPSVEGGNRFRWTKTITGKDWDVVLAKLDIGKLKSVTDLARGFSGRIYQMTFKGTKDSKIVMKELTIRRLLGSLRSSCFTADWKKDSSGNIIGVTLRGAGFGHGVGMCQTGAQALAKRGWSYKRILSHYYIGSILKKWY